MTKRRRNILKRIGVAVLCAAFVLPAAIPVGASVRAAGIQNLSARSESLAQGTANLARIQISVGDGQETPVFRAGEKAQLNISVKNSGNINARNVRIAPVIQNEADWPFELNKLNYELGLGTLEAGKQTDALWGVDNDMLTVKSDVSGKAYKLTFRIDYDDGENAYETEKYVFVKTTARNRLKNSRPAGIHRIRARLPDREIRDSPHQEARCQMGQELTRR